MWQGPQTDLLRAVIWDSHDRRNVDAGLLTLFFYHQEVYYFLVIHFIVINNGYKDCHGKLILFYDFRIGENLRCIPSIFYEMPKIRIRTNTDHYTSADGIKIPVTVSFISLPLVGGKYKRGKRNHCMYFL